MRIAVNTNILLRAFLNDDAAQSQAAIDVLDRAELAAISLHVMCEFVRVLTRTYSVTRRDIATTIRDMLDTANFVLARPALEAGLAVLEAGSDFADGAIAYDGRSLGGETFVSFDRRAVRLLAEHGYPTQLLV